MSIKKIVVLGSTGSIGKSTLDIAGRYPDKFRVIAISSNSNADLLIEQASKFRPKYVAVNKTACIGKIKDNVPAGIKVGGPDFTEQLAALKEADLIVMAIAGTAALKPLMAAIEAGKTIALASKEPIVSAGEIVMRLCKKKSAKLLPVDSEHSALFQCLAGKTAQDVGKLYITGSGGTLWNKKDRDLDSFSLEEVLSHPKWSMGKKITVDSATLMNKGLEVIEARWLFDVKPNKIDVVIHPEAIIHAMVEFADGTINACLFNPDMRFPILRALSYPEILKSSLEKIDFCKLGNISFHAPDYKRFPALDLARTSLKKGGTVPAVLNSANEAAVNLFLENKIKFTQIIKIVEKVLSRHRSKSKPVLSDIFESEKWALEEVHRVC
ncbi:MAG TPA: 1-deoxy-D-xylulose-5-phosphate reductoisomerase [Candidatus Omnitrophota bacterium]|nr:1-deoxy-D-xylulose-5-phosphate reductoisomerase [Candidatus Omnitrophota bacterium]HPS19863.1 1-deoxy-D-xylulose-5-phosphate reductoisomerase [Candidatus Omnitrophota bacterium]